MKNGKWLWLVVAMGMTVAGCSSTGGPRDEVPVDDRSTRAGAEGAGAGGAGAEGYGGAQAGGASMTGGFQGHPLDDPDSLLAKRVFYFDFDSAQVSEEDRAALEAHASYLADNPAMSAVLEGHADERGSREYNLALGERRAQAVEKLLVIQAVGKDQLQVVSFGEERPVALGHEEDAWRLNRRVELIYSGY